MIFTTINKKIQSSTLKELYPTDKRKPRGLHTIEFSETHYTRCDTIVYGMTSRE